MNTPDDTPQMHGVSADEKTAPPDAARGRMRQDKFRATLHLACFTPDKNDVKKDGKNG